ncbi:MAG: hypothetical protein NUV56_00800, partial [Candidatus Uhrbacteria bacterium]|nr:hypothetical protein [Candidatus Uhrbacteria bacterium]
MQNVLQTGKRALSVAVAAATIMFSAGASLLTPTVAAAASTGDLIKGTSLSTVYYYGFDGMRYTFPNEKTFMTWFEDFDSVSTISDSALADISLAGNVVYRPGSYWIKIQSDPKTYAVSTDGSIHWIESEDVAVDFAGSNWASSIHDVSDVFFTDYSVGTSLMTADAFDGMLYMDGGDYFIAWDGEKREVSSAGRNANNLQAGFFLDGSGIDDSGLTAGSEITGESAMLIDPAQTVTDDGSDATGDLEISLSSSTSAGSTVPKGANAVEVLSFDVEAGSEDATLDTLALELVGVGATSAISNVYLYEGNDRLTDARSVNASTRMVSFSSLGLEVGAGDERTFTVRIEIATGATAGDEIQFAISSADDVGASGDVDGSFPIEGGAFEIANVSVGEIDIHRSGTITNPTVGADDAVIAEFKITANSEAASVESIILKIDNESDHDDIWLWDGSTPLVEGVSLGSKLVSFDLSSDPFEIAEGSNNIFSVSADIGGDAADTIKVSVDNAVDVVAIGGDYGFGMTADINDASGSYGYDGTTCATGTLTTNLCSFSTLQGGDVTFAFTGPNAGDIATNAQDQTVMEFTLTAQNQMTVKDLDIFIYADDDADSDATDGVDSAGVDDDGLIDSSSVATVTDIKIVNVDTGEVVMGPLELDTTTDDAGASPAEDAVQTIDFTDDFQMETGESLNLAVVVDVGQDADGTDGFSNTEIAAGIDISGFQAEDSNGDTICTSGCSTTNVVPTADLKGYNQEATSASLTLQLASSFTDTNVTMGKQDTTVLSFSAAAGDAGDVLISALTFQGYALDNAEASMVEGGGTGAQLEDYVGTCTLYSGDDIIDGPEGVETDGDVVFSNFEHWISASDTEVLDLMCDLNRFTDTAADGSSADSETADYIAFDIDIQTDITAEDENGNAVTPALTDAGSADEDLNDTNAGDSTFDASSSVRVWAAGTIAAAVSSGTPSAGLLTTGSSSNYVGAFTYTATYEDFLIDKVVIEEVAGTEFTGTSTTYANNVSMVTITYPEADGSTGTSSKVMSGNQATFTGLEFFVDVDDAADLKVYVSVPSSDRNSGGAATSNERIEVALADGASDMNAVGADSGTADTDVGSADVDTDITYIVRETVPTISISSSSPSGAKVPSDQEVLRFNIAASGNEDVVFSEMIFKVSASDNASESTTDGQPDWQECDSDITDGTYGVATSDLDFYNLSEQGTSTPLDVNADWTIMVNNGTSTFATCGATQYDVTYFHMTLATKEVVPAGTPYEYSLYWDMGGAQGASASSDDVVQVSLVNDAFATYSTTGNDVAATTLANGLNDADLAITATTVNVDTGLGAVMSVGDLIVVDMADD